jgi:hypothetical protein
MGWSSSCRSGPLARTIAIASVLVVASAGLSACRADPSYEWAVHQASPADFARWWEREQAVRQGVGVATVRWWLRHRPEPLDAPAARRGYLDVSTDLCSFAPNAGPAFDFRLPCVRHDVAWRNLRRGRAPNTAAQRRRANGRFESDARASCATRSALERTPCRAVARLYRLVLDAVA